MLKIRKKIFTFNKDEEVYMGHLSIWNKDTEVHFWGKINQNYEKNLDKISKDDFKNSFYIKIINFEFSENAITIDLYMGTEPDYLMGHFINIKISNDFNINVHYTYVLPTLIRQAIQRNLRKPWKTDDKILIFPYVEK